jgi:hypothetical protein
MRDGARVSAVHDRRVRPADLLVDPARPNSRPSRPDRNPIDLHEAWRASQDIACGATQSRYHGILFVTRRDRYHIVTDPDWVPLTM